jgi:hypothetical protein
VALELGFNEDRFGDGRIMDASTRHWARGGSWEAHETGAEGRIKGGMIHHSGVAIV